MFIYSDKIYNVSVSAKRRINIIFSLLKNQFDLKFEYSLFLILFDAGILFNFD